MAGDCQANQDRRSGLLSDLELDRPTGFPLNDSGAVSHLATDAHVVDAQPDEVAAAQLAVDREIEQRKVASASLKLQADADGPDLLRFQWAFLADQPALVPWGFRKADQRRDRGACLPPWSRPRPPQHRVIH
jgi:hypothetical protein